MAIATKLCTSFLQALLDGEMDLSSDTAQTFKIALYDSSATLNENTTAYFTDNEVSGTGYTAGGETLTVNGTSAANGVAYADFADVTWSAATFSARGALIYKEAAGNPAVATVDFGDDQSVSAADFTVQFPSAASTTAIIRIS
ncbi:MAG TPA: hypothetical protein VKP88_04200 [Candidatus Paceibacterota bacterium]|nr:hypothetical protein [Candidatus Paceibacterota bacterium]